MLSIAYTIIIFFSFLRNAPTTSFDDIIRRLTKILHSEFIRRREFSNHTMGNNLEAVSSVEEEKVRINLGSVKLGVER